MAGFRFRLATLTRLRQTARDERQQEFAAAQERQRAMNDRIAIFEHEVAELRRRSATTTGRGSIDLELLRDAARYQSLLIAQRDVAQRELDDCSADVDRLRESLAEADRELKSLEKLHQRQEARHLQTQRKREFHQLDEAGIRIAMRRDHGA
jgi:flagellar protein FliJ